MEKDYAVKVENVSTIFFKNFTVSPCGVVRTGVYYIM